jgi:hypothetical protein
MGMRHGESGRPRRRRLLDQGQRSCSAHRGGGRMIEPRASAMIVSAADHRDRGEPIAAVNPDDPPAADQATVRRSAHAAPRTFGGSASFVGSREAEGPSDAFPAADPGSLPAVGRLDSAEGFLDLLADALASRVAGIACHAGVDRRRAGRWYSAPRETSRSSNVVR